MPTATYQELLSETLPSRIETEADYERLYERFKALFRAKRRSAAEQRLYGLLAVLIEDYDRRNALPPTQDSPGERLQAVMELAGKKTADLIRIFGQRSHVHEALTGKRPISAAQARKLGELFHLDPGYFL